MSRVTSRNGTFLVGPRDFRDYAPVPHVPNQQFNVSTPDGKNGILIKQLENVPDYKERILEHWRATKTPSVTHATRHGLPRSKSSYEVHIPEIKAEMLEIIRKEVEAAAGFYNYSGRKATNFAQQILLYEPGFGCVVHCDDVDNGENQYGIGTMVFNWGNQLIALLFISTEGVDYEGGKLYFPNADFQVDGVHGKLVMCPGHYKYLHGVSDILSGYRLAIQTTWRFDL